MDQKHQEIENFILDYLTKKYEGAFEIIEVEKLTNITNIGEEKTITARVFSVLSQKDFTVFATDAPTPRIFEDQYPQILVEDAVTSNINNELDSSIKVFAYAEKLEKEVRESITSSTEIHSILGELTKSSWTIFILCKVGPNHLETNQQSVNDVIDKLFSTPIYNINVECIFYSEASAVDLENAKIDIDAMFNEKFPNHEDITETWVGYFSRATENYASQMRVIKE